LIDKEVKNVINQAYHYAQDVITRYRNKLKTIAEMLREEETLDADKFESIFADLPPQSKLVLTRQPVPA